MLEINLDTSGLNNLKEQLKQQQENLRNSEGFNKILSKIVSEDVTKRFNEAPKTQKGGEVHGGEIWKPLKQSTLKQRPDRLNKQILVDTGRLKNSFSINNPENKVSNSFQSWTYGSRVPYAGKQNKSRKILFWHKDLLDKVQKAYMEYIMNTGSTS